MTTKICSKCRKRKFLTDFYRDNGRTDKRQAYCKICLTEYNKRYHREHREQRLKCRHNSHLVRKYGITLEQYNTRLKNQKGCCAICMKHRSKFRRRLDVHHDWNTGKIGGLLCGSCNKGLGMFNHDRNLLMKAIHFLDKD